MRILKPEENEILDILFRWIEVRPDGVIIQYKNKKFYCVKKEQK